MSQPTYRQLKALAWVIREAEAWEGLYTGNPDADQILAERRKVINDAKEILRVLRRERQGVTLSAPKEKK